MLNAVSPMLLCLRIILCAPVMFMFLFYILVLLIAHPEVFTWDYWFLFEMIFELVLFLRIISRLLVFWVPHIHWRRLRDKVEDIPEDLAIRNLHIHAHAQAVDRRSTASQQILRMSQSVDS